MAKQSVLGAPSAPNGSGSRSGFSRSQAYTFTCAGGMLLPAYREFLNYGEHVTGIPRCFVRTEPLLAPSMTDLDLYLDVFFVPMTHLFSMYDNWFTQIQDDSTTLWNSSSWPSNLPMVSKNIGSNPEAFGWMNSNFWFFPTSSADDGNSDITCFGFDLHRLTQMLGYNAQGIFANFGNFDYSTNPPSNVLPSFVNVAKNTHQDPFVPYFYQAYQKIYFDYYRDSNYEENVVKAYNLDSDVNAGHSVFYPANLNDPSLNMFRLRYRNRTKDYFTAIHPAPVFSGLGMLPNASSFLSRINNWLTNQSPSLFQDPDVFGVGLRGSGLTEDNDVYNGDPSLTVVPNNLGIYHGNLSDSPTQNDIYHTHELDMDPLSLAQMRSAFALDKLLRIVNRAGKHVDDQIMAQFGVKIPEGVCKEVYKLKSYHTIFHIGEVIQSATTVDSSGNDVPLGEMAGRGVALLNGNDNFSFTAPTTGILMAIFSIAPRYKYAFAQEKDGYKTYIEDFFRPAFDNLGMQPVFGYELGSTDSSVVSGAWQYRYMEDKIKFDKASMVFATISKNPWSFVKAPTNRSYYGYVQTNWSLSAYTSAWQKVSPYDLNNLFVVQYDGMPGYPGYSQSIYTNYKTPVHFLSAYLTDPFTVDFEMKLTKVSQMSTYGEPSLGGI